MLVAAIGCFCYAYFQEKKQRAIEEREKADFHANFGKMFGEDLVYTQPNALSAGTRSRAESGDYTRNNDNFGIN